MSTSATPRKSISGAFLSELENEIKTTRTILERVPADKFAYQPHEKSMTFSRLAVHVAEMFGWITMTMKTDVLDFAENSWDAYEPKTTEELLGFFDKTVAEAKEVLENCTDENFMEDWTMKNGETVYFTMPKIAVLRTWCFNHIYHHRGQLSVYLRLNDIAVPSIYGPSADEGEM